MLEKLSNFNKGEIYITTSININQFILNLNKKRLEKPDEKIAEIKKISRKKLYNHK